MVGINILNGEFFEIEMDEDGRGLHIRLDESIKSNPHHRELKKYVKKLLKQGVTKFNVDHIGLEGRDKSITLTRGKTRIDLAYWQDGIFYECELKTGYEVGLDRTWTQLKNHSKHCNRVTLLVPRIEVSRAEEMCRSFNLNNVYVQSYE